MILSFVRGTKAALDAKDLVFRSGEPIYETDTKRFKIGDGATPYSGLPYFTPGSPSGNGGDVGALLAHIYDSNPHPVYDDGPSLLLLYNNAKV